MSVRHRVFFQTCAKGRKVYRWSSQPKLCKRGVYAGDFLLATNILLSGNNYEKVLVLHLLSNYEKVVLLHLLSGNNYEKVFSYIIDSIEYVGLSSVILSTLQFVIFMSVQQHELVWWVI